MGVLCAGAVAPFSQYAAKEKHLLRPSMFMLIMIHYFGNISNSRNKIIPVLCHPLLDRCVGLGRVAAADNSSKRCSDVKGILCIHESQP